MSTPRSSSIGSSTPAPPPPPVRSPYSSTPRRSVVGLGPLPPPPAGIGSPAAKNSNFSDSIAKSMTIEEMRHLHQGAMREAEAKRTELKLVLASRYRELVGSSDEVIRMNERAQELHDLVEALPSLVEKLAKPQSSDPSQESKSSDEQKDARGDAVLQVRHKLSTLPRSTHRALDVNDVHKATTTLIELFSVIASQTDAYKLANVLSAQPPNKAPKDMDPALDAQLRMIFLQVQTLPDRITRIATKNLLRSASYGPRHAKKNPSLGAYDTAAAISSLDLLVTDKAKHSASVLLDLYFDSKAKLLVSLLNQLQTPKVDEVTEASTSQAEDILSKIVLILQYDALLHPYQIFVLRNVPYHDAGAVQRIMSSLPVFDKTLVYAKCSRFMATHLPLIRTKVKSVLVSIAGTTASALGQIRQSLYDRTDGAECMERLDNNGVCTWNQAVEDMVDVRAVLNSADGGGGATQTDRFSLWNALFSNTFSSLVHSLLTTSFQSVHTLVVSTLRMSLASAPPTASILPREAYRNTLQIATDLNKALLKVKDDAHELLVHAEERVESERRLKESLYVHSCEILGRLVCELRRLVNADQKSAPGGGSGEATKELIVGRLCHLLKFRLTVLPTLLDPASSPAAMQSTTGMISYVDLQSAFELGDHDEDGIISFEEAMQAVESAFSGTQFHGAEMVRDTLLLPGADGKPGSPSETPDDVTLDELVLLTARGLRHEKSGIESALGAFQRSLDKIIDACFSRWADAALESASTNLDTSMRSFMRDSAGASEGEWERMYSAQDPSISTDQRSGPRVRNVSPHLVGFLLAVSSVLNCNTCPSDSLSPVPSDEYAAALGIVADGKNTVPKLMHALRWALLTRSLSVLATQAKGILEATEAPGGELEKNSASSLMQLRIDVSFISFCYFDRNNNDFGPSPSTTKLVSSCQSSLKALSERVDTAIKEVCGAGAVRAVDSEISERHLHVLVSSDLFFASLLGETKTSVSAAGEIVGNTIAGSEPLFHMPLTSSRRFALLPVPADRTISEIQLRGKYTRDKEEAADQRETSSASVVSSGLGFLSSMLKNR